MHWSSAASIGELDGVRLVEDPFSADVILLGGPDDEWTYQRLNGVFRSVMAGAQLVAMQRNRWWPTASGPSLDAGMFVAGLEFSARVSATVVGKPSPAIYERACALMGVDPGDAMMVGDDLESDLPPARQIGMRTCLLRTGKGATFPDRADVDLDLPSLAALPGGPLTAGRFATVPRRWFAALTSVPAPLLCDGCATPSRASRTDRGRLVRPWSRSSR